METLPIIVLAAIAIVSVTALAPRFGLSAPLTLVVVGVGISFLPWVTVPAIEPEWILAVVLPPLLYSTSVSMPTMDFRRDFTAIGGLSVFLVVISSTLLGVMFWALIPDINLAMGIALGAIVSPTDAVATTIVRKLGVSPRLVTVLEGESLLNDASALVVLRSAVAAAAATASVSFGSIVGSFVYSVVVAVGIGVVVGWLSLYVRKRIADASVNTAISFIVPFVAYLPTEHFGASGLVAAVAAGLVAGAGSAKNLRPQDRMSEHSNWRTLSVLLEGAVFFVMGLELDGLVLEVREENGSITLAIALGILAAVAVLIVRAGFLAPLLWLLNRRARRGLKTRDYLTTVQEKLDDGDIAALRRMQNHGQRRGPQSRPVGRTLRRRRLAHRPGRSLSVARIEHRAERERTGSRSASAVRVGEAVRAEAHAGEVVRAEARAGEAVRADTSRSGGRNGGQDGRDGRRTGSHRVEAVSRRITRRVADIDYVAGEPLGVREGALLVWAGMRGVVTLAAAQSLPVNAPQRPVLILVAFVVAAGTLLLQGATLPRVVRRLGLVRDNTGDAEERRRLFGELHEAATKVLGNPDLRDRDGNPYGDAIMAKVRKTLADDDERRADAGKESSERIVDAARVREIRLRMIEAEREALLDARRLGTYSSTTLRQALTILDSDQLSAELRVEE